MKVSICIPTFNRYEYLKECIESILAQTYMDIEIIVSDNASKDETHKITKEYPNIKYYRHTEPLNWYENWNFAVSKASGEYIALYHDDDLYCVNMIEEVVSIFKEKKDTLLVHTGSYHFTEDNKNLINKKVRIQDEHPLFMKSKEYLDYSSTNWCSINCPTVMVRADLYKNYKFNANYLSADYHMWFKILQNDGYIAYLNKPLMNYRQHDSVKNNIDNPRAIYEYKEMFISSLSKSNLINKKLYENNLDKLINDRILLEYNIKDIFNIFKVKEFFSKIRQYGFKCDYIRFYSFCTRRIIHKIQKI
jgi:glycosyltransferase involved in cell wall biosynthesis